MTRRAMFPALMARARVDLAKRAARGTLSPHSRSSWQAGQFSPLASRVLVVSPHLDDAIFSLGAAMASHIRNGGSVTVLTVLAGDPNTSEPAATWDRLSGFTTARESVLARRCEDKEACSVIGVAPIHLDGQDGQYSPARDDDSLGAAIRLAAARHDEVLVPGHPLHHPDHEYVNRLTLAALVPGTRIRLYAEEPYTAWLRRSAAADLMEDSSTEPAGWGSVLAGASAIRLKALAASKYRSQLPPLTGMPTLGAAANAARARFIGLLWHEARTRGELISAPIRHD